VIEQDLSDEELKALYLSCDCLVAPSKAEGFGLPLAEAMLCGMEVIVTGWSGQLDFCTDQTAWILDYDFESANSHLGVFDSVWARPSKRHLTTLMKDVRSLTGEERGRRSTHGRLLLEERFQWKHVAERMKMGALRIASGISRFEPRVGWISTWNTRCGIATYSAHLVRHMPSPVAILAPDAQELTEEDTANVVRCWDQYASPDLSRLQSQIDKLDLDTLVVQFNYGFFDFAQLATFITHQVDLRGRHVVAVLHSTQDPPDARAQNK
ncbi:glycosyltransferase, partial [Pseudomonas aeruginosa]|uniref:glycosyltransferase n=2 Tax=Pseudomonadota TaxID=1224 RepID=UPI0015BF3C15